MMLLQGRGEKAVQTAVTVGQIHHNVMERGTV